MHFNEYWKVLWEIKRDCPVEQYYDKILRPLFEEAAGSMENVKVVPSFDTRIRSTPKKVPYQVIIGNNANLVWPDYIFVPLTYTHESPVRPYAAVESKFPNIEKRGDGPGWIYCPLETLTRNNKIHTEIASEISRYPVIFTDGITWLFLSSQEDLAKIESLDCQENICLINKTQKYKSNARDRKYYAEPFPDTEEPFNRLKERICSFLKESIEKYK